MTEDLFEIRGNTLVKYHGSESTVKIPEGITMIGEGCLSDNADIKNVILPESLTHIGKCAFKGCSGLNEINLPEQLTEIGGAAFSASGIENIVIPESVQNITLYCVETVTRRNPIPFQNNFIMRRSMATGLFEDCENLSEVTINAPIKSVQIFMFRNCKNLRKVTLPGSIEYIRHHAFDGCIVLREIHFGGTKEQFGNIKTDGLEAPENIEVLCR